MICLPGFYLAREVPGEGLNYLLAENPYRGPILGKGTNHQLYRREFPCLLTTSASANLTLQGFILNAN